MDRAKVNLWLDITILVVFIVVAFTSLTFFFRIDTGMNGSLLFIHQYLGLILIVLLAIHFILHCSWIVCMIKSKK